MFEFAVLFRNFLGLPRAGPAMGWAPSPMGRTQICGTGHGLDAVPYAAFRDVEDAVPYADNGHPPLRCNTKYDRKSIKRGWTNAGKSV